jgi:hypothetical protein
LAGAGQGSGVAAWTELPLSAKWESSRPRFWIWAAGAIIIAWLGALRRASRHVLTANRRHILLHCAVHKAGLSSSRQEEDAACIRQAFETNSILTFDSLSALRKLNL